MRPLAVLALLAALAGCGSPAATSAPPPTTAASTPTTAWAIDPSFNSSDLAWVELMIPMDEQLLRVLGMAEKQAADPAVRAFATAVAGGHRDEVEKLKAIRTRSGVPTRNPHQGHDMPGMMTEPEIVALGKASGPAFDRLFAQNLKEHLEESIALAKGISTDGKDAAVKHLAESIRTSRAAQLKQLASLQTKM